MHQRSRLNRATPPRAAIAKLERAYLKAHKAEQAAVAALPENPPKAMTDRCWALADATNAARRELTAARDAAEATHV